MRLSTLLILLISLVASKQLQKKEEDRRELLVVTITVACLAAVAGGVATAVTAHALNGAGQAQVQAPQQNVQVNNVNVNIHLHLDPNSGQWVQRSIRGSARRLLASSGDAEQPCPADALRLPVEDAGGHYRIPNKFANTDVNGCEWWIRPDADVEAYKLLTLAPTDCAEIIRKATGTNIVAANRKIQQKKILPAATSGGKQPSTAANTNLGAVKTNKVEAIQKVEIFPKLTWQVLGVVLLGVTLLLVSCFASAQRKEVDLYFPLEENVDEF